MTVKRDRGMEKTTTTSDALLLVTAPSLKRTPSALSSPTKAKQILLPRGTGHSACAPFSPRKGT